MTLLIHWLLEPKPPPVCPCLRHRQKARWPDAIQGNWSIASAWEKLPLNYSVSTVQSTGLSQQSGKLQPSAKRVLMRQDSTGRKRVGEEETSVGRCQGGRSMLESPGPLSSFPGGNVGSGKGAVHRHGPLCRQQLTRVLPWCMVHSTHLLLGYLLLEGRGLTYFLAV